MASKRTTANTNPDPFLNTEQAAEFLGVSPGTMANWRWSKAPGKPPHVHLGAGKNAPVRYRRSELVSYLERQTVYT